MSEPQDGSIQSGAISSELPRSGSLPFHEIVEQVANLPTEDQDALMDVIKRRRADLRRTEIAEDIEKSRKEFAERLALRGTVDDLMQEFGH